MLHVIKGAFEVLHSRFSAPIVAYNATISNYVEHHMLNPSCSRYMEGYDQYIAYRDVPVVHGWDA